MARSVVRDGGRAQIRSAPGVRSSPILCCAVAPQRSEWYSFWEKVGDALESGTKVFRVFRLLPPLSVGFGFGTGCGIGLGWSFPNVQKYGIGAAPRAFVGCGAGIGVGIGIGHGFGKNIIKDQRPDNLRPKNIAETEADIRAGLDRLGRWWKKTTGTT